MSVDKDLYKILELEKSAQIQDGKFVMKQRKFGFLYTNTLFII